jgi:hypothetical protein
MLTKSLSLQSRLSVTFIYIIHIIFKLPVYQKFSNMVSVVTHVYHYLTLAF